MSEYKNIEVTTTTTVADLAYQMTEGERIHMANHLYRHYGIGPQKLKNPQGKHINVNGVDYILVRDGE
jgi:hypothetical protein